MNISYVLNGSQYKHSGARTKNKLKGQTRRRTRRVRKAEVVQGEPLPIRQGGLGERREPLGAKRIWCILTPAGGRWWQRFTKFCSISYNAETIIHVFIYILYYRCVYSYKVIHINYITAEKYASDITQILLRDKEVP